MEQSKTVHFEIQVKNSKGQWTELPQHRPIDEQEIPDLCHRAAIDHPGATVRAVKVITTTVTLEEESQESRVEIPTHDMESGGLRYNVPLSELLQDCD